MNNLIIIVITLKENDNSKVSMTQDDSSLSSGCLKELNAKLSHTQAILNETQIERDSLKEVKYTFPMF